MENSGLTFFPSTRDSLLTSQVSDENSYYSPSSNLVFLFIIGFSLIGICSMEYNVPEYSILCIYPAWDKYFLYL